MEKLIQYTKRHFKPSRQYGCVHNVDKMVDEAVEWVLDMVSINNCPNGKIDIDLFRKEMADWYMSCY